MPIDPLTIVAEILGEPAAAMRNPVNADYQCPFINSTCIKRSQRIDGPYPVCTIHAGKRNPERICVCPKRFYGIEDLQRDVIEYCWVGDPPKNPQIAHEIKMEGFGNVDFVIADVDATSKTVTNFISVELQAVDITGSVETAYSAVLHNKSLPKWPSYGINWANVRKRYVSQLIAKGFFHHHWNSRMVAVVQTALYDRFREYIKFDELPVASKCNIVFMLYKYQPVSGEPDGAQELVLDRVVGTSHNSLMTGSLYREMPPRDDFCKRVLAKLS